jgi:hypothetical protein
MPGHCTNLRSVVQKRVEDLSYDCVDVYLAPS